MGAVGVAGGRAAGPDQPTVVGVYAQIVRRRGKQIATVAVACRLLARSFHILKQLQTAPESEKVKTGRARVYA